MYDVITARQVAFRNAVTASVSLLAGTTAVYMLFATPAERRDMKALYAGIGLASSVAGLAATRNTESMVDVLSTYKDVSKLVRATSLYQRMLNPVQSSTKKGIFDWTSFKDEPDEYPHALILGASGDGKSTLAENLAGLMHPAIVYGVVPHYQAGDFVNCDRLVAQGRNIGDGFDGDPTTTPPLYTWQDIERLPDTPISACELLHSLYWEMHRRYQLDNSGKFLGAKEKELVIILDEFLSYARLPGVRQLWTKLVREARKVKIRLILIVQGDGVASLGIEGEGDIRENLTYIYLKNFALEEAERWYNGNRQDRKPYYQWVTQQFKSCRPCWVEDKLAYLPQPGEYGRETSTQVLKPGSTTSFTEVRASPPNPDRVYVESSPVVTDSEPQADGFLEGYDEVIASLSPEQLDYTLKQLWEVAMKACDESMPSGSPYTQEAIIKKLWGYESSNYKTGKVLWALAQTKYGRIPLKM